MTAPVPFIVGEKEMKNRNIWLAVEAANYRHGIIIGRL
jgi:hypothetical protein